MSVPLTATWAQADTVRWAVEGAMDRFTTDELGNLYTLRGNDLDLYDPHGRHVAHNSLNTFGAISRIDAFSSLKPLIFSRAQGQLAMLDNTLSVQGSVLDLSRNGFPQVTLACMSVQGRIWFFDERELALMRVDAQLRPWPIPADLTSSCPSPRSPLIWKRPMTVSTWWTPNTA
ncbi:MAG: hypothetical protein IPL81_14065 [Flavobacteriales bacterium]|nr:hypothetical protein [Flavobacteriales bacterium]